MLGIHLTDAPPFETVYLSGPDPRPVRREDVEDEGQHGRPAGDDRRARRRRAPVRARPRRRRPGKTSGSARRRSRTPATSPTSCGTRRATCIGARPASIAGGRRAAPARRRPTWARPTAGCCRASRPRRPRSTRRWRTSTSARSRACCTTRSGTSTATGASSWPRCASPTTSLPAAEREATWWTLVEALDAYLRLLHPVMPFITETLWDAIPHRATDPGLLIVARWPGVGERDTRCGGAGRGARSTSSGRSATPAPTRSSSPAPGCRSTCTWSPTSGMRSRRSGRPWSGSPARVRSAATSPARTSTGRPARPAAGWP